MRLISAFAIGLACAACQPHPDPTLVATAPGQPQAVQNLPSCRPFSAPVTAAGKPEQASGRACRQPDGTWRVVQDTPGLPTQEFLVPHPGQNASAASGDPQPSAVQTADAQPTANPPSCTRYTAPVIVGGQSQQATIEACPQADGSWQITQNTPGLPLQVYTVPPPASSSYPYGYPYPADYAYSDFFPYWAGTPWFFGLAPSIVVVQKFHHFHHGFTHGFAHGHGFGHGFAAAHGMGGHR